MKLLLDTHYLLWVFIEPQRIHERLRADLLADDNEVYYSQISLWEMAIKFRLGKLTLQGVSPEQFYDHVKASYFQCLTLENDALVSFYKLPIEHKDPFERMLIWQAICADFYLISVDKEMGPYRKYGLKLYRDVNGL